MVWQLDSKTGAKTLYLSSPAPEVLCIRECIEGNPWCLPRQIQGQPLVYPQKPWRRIRHHAGLGDVRRHSLRHTYASMATRTGFSLPMIGALLGHQQAATTARHTSSG